MISACQCRNIRMTKGLRNKGTSYNSQLEYRLTQEVSDLKVGGGWGGTGRRNQSCRIACKHK